MVPFKLLPELKEVNVRRGHKFRTKQFEIYIPDTKISLYMPSSCLWINGEPHIVEDAERVVLFQRNHHRNDGKIMKEVCLGLLDEYGDGIIIKYNMSSKTYSINNTTKKIKSSEMTFNQITLPDIGIL